MNKPSATLTRPQTVPDELPLTERQAERLAELTGISSRELVKQPIRKLAEAFKWQIDPQLFLFRRICGKVVKKDPVTGVVRPVPFATVHVEDTDFGFLGFFPSTHPWGWLLPLYTRREELTQVQTDECGRFCCWIPRFDIDYILRWRIERHCFPILFKRPRLIDLLEEIPYPGRPPLPDPPPYVLKRDSFTLRRATQLIGRETAEKLFGLEETISLGGSTVARQQLLDQEVFKDAAPPPLEPGMLRNFQEQRAKLADIEGVESLELSAEKFIGPFLRCTTTIVPEWTPILDVPDITFRVTQDVNGDGVEETIYNESFFDVRWNAGNIPDVTLYASPIAIPGVACHGPDIPFTDPGIYYAGLMPFLPPPSGDPFHDNVTGYAVRPNRPHPSGLVADPPPNPLAKTPFTGELQLYGINEMPNAQFYRIKYSVDGGPPLPFLNTWTVTRPVGSPPVLQIQNVTPDASGWYPVLPISDGWIPSHLLMDWPTGQNGLFEIFMELGDSGKNVIKTTDKVRIKVDNSAAQGQFTKLEWRTAGGAWHELELICPVIERPKGEDIEIRVSAHAWAQHLRSAHISGSGCGDGIPTAISTLSTREHWHTDPVLDNFYSNDANPAVFAVDGTAKQGAYGFHLSVYGRAFNPSGGDGGFAAGYNYDPVYTASYFSLPVSIVDI